MKISEICTRDVVIANPGDSVLEAARLMRRYHVGDVIIVEQQDNQNTPLGIVTDRDIVLELVAKEIDVNSVTTGDLMTTELLVVKEDEQLTEVIQKMQEKGVRRAPVIDGAGALIGIISEDDLIEIISEQLNSLVSLTSRSAHREQAVRT